MANKKIPCGGFYIDDETLSLSDDNKLSVKGGGSGGGVLVVHQDANDTLDKTWQEIHDAEPLVFAEIEDIYYLLNSFENSDDYFVVYYEVSPTGIVVNTYIAIAADDYPTIVK